MTVLAMTPESILTAATPDASTAPGYADAAPLATDGGGAGRESPDDARPGGAAAAVRDFDAIATALIKTAISNAANARLLIGSERGPRPMVQLWNLADDLGRVARELKSAIVEKSDPRPFAPKPTGRA